MQSALQFQPAQVRTLRPYQSEAVAAIERDLETFDRILLSLATGGGKTIIAAELARRNPGRILFIADASELVRQAADKIGAWVGEEVGVEMGDDNALGWERIIVGTTQSMHRRLDRWGKGCFNLIVVDEAHRNTLGGMAQKVLNHFDAKVVGITATPFRADKKQLANYYETISYEAGLESLIPQGYLAPITVQQVPVNIDLRGVGTRAGDYREEELAEAITPYLTACANLLKEYAGARRSVVFLPLIATSRLFCDICRAIGLDAVHVDGVDRASLRGNWRVICNSALLTTGWDEPSVDCVMILRPTKSLVLYSQMVGRGTRIFPGKRDLLLLDPLYLTDKHDIIKPVRLFARTDEEVAEMETVLATGGGRGELMQVRDHAVSARHERLVREMEEKRKRKARVIDLLSWSVTIGDDELADYEPVSKWESEPLTEKQHEILERNGFDPDEIRCKGLASKVLDTIFKRRDLGLCTPKQMRWLIKLGYRNPETATFQQASEFLNRRFGK